MLIGLAHSDMSHIQGTMQTKPVLTDVSEFPFATVGLHFLLVMYSQNMNKMTFGLVIDHLYFCWHWEKPP